jgi:hypothetical protein
MPHMAHMLFAGVMCIIFAGMALMMVSRQGQQPCIMAPTAHSPWRPHPRCCPCRAQSVGTCDMNPMTRSRLASSDATASFKILGLKIVFVLVSTAIDEFDSVLVHACRLGSTCAATLLAQSQQRGVESSEGETGSQ